jgi:exonuclease III
MNQFGVPQEEREEIHGVFEWYVIGAFLDLGFNPIPDQNRFAWRLRLSTPRRRFIADLGERLDALVSSEAITERTNGAMHRMIAPQRMRMSHRVLLNVARHDK